MSSKTYNIRKKITVEKTSTFIIVALFIILLALIYSFYTDVLSHINSKKNIIDEMLTTHHIYTILLTMLLIWIAAKQLSGIKTIQESEYLLKIDERWHSKTIISAREIIHELALLTDHASGGSRVIQRRLIGLLILEMRNSPTGGQEFISLLNMLDFLETIGYLFKTRRITEDQVYDLFHHSITNYFEMFEPYIKDRRNRCGDQKIYEHIEILHYRLKNREKRS